MHVIELGVLVIMLHVKESPKFITISLAGKPFPVIVNLVPYLEPVCGEIEVIFRILAIKISFLA